MNVDHAYKTVNRITGDHKKTVKILKALGINDPMYLPKKRTNRERYESTINYNELTRKYNIQHETGLWNIYGETPNCDFGGTGHHEPFLETVEGKLTAVIDYAVNIDGFWAWGAGGRIEKVTTKKV